MGIGRHVTMKSDTMMGLTFQLITMHASAAATPSHQPHVQAVQRRVEGRPAWHPVMLFGGFLEIEEATGKIFPAEPKGATRPEELSDFVPNLPLGDPSLRGVRNVSAVAPREPRVVPRLALMARLPRVFLMLSF